MANDWPVVRLGDVVDLLAGFPFSSERYTKDESAPRLLRGDNVGQGVIRWDGAMRWPAGLATGLHDYWLRRGDVVLAMDRPWIEAGLKYAAVREFDTPALLVQRVARLRGTKRLDTGFLKYVIGGRAFTEHILAMQTGTAVPHISGRQILSFKFSLPPLGVQRAIAYVLGTLDDKIELNRRMTETLEGVARNLFRSWFVEFEPVRAKVEGRSSGLPAPLDKLFPARFVDSELGDIPQGWRPCSFSELCDSIFSGGTPSTTRPDYWGGDIPWLSSGETRSKFIVATEKTITAKGVSDSSTRLAKAGATVIASAGQGHTRGQTSMLMFDSYINQSVVAIQADSRYTSNTHLFFDLERRYEQFRQVSDGHSSRGSLTTKLVADLRGVVPQRPLIEAFDRTAIPVVYRIASALGESRTLTDLRDTLLPKLISGELGGPRAERMLEAAPV